MSKMAARAKNKMGLNWKNLSLGFPALPDSNQSPQFKSLARIVNLQVLKGTKKCANQSVQKHMLICHFVVCKPAKTGFLAQGWHRLEKYLNIQDCLEKSLKIKFALKSTLKTLIGLEKSLNFTIYRRIQQCFWRPKSVKKLWCLYLVQHMLHQIKAPQFYTIFFKLISLVMDSSISQVEY